MGNTLCANKKNKEKVDAILSDLTEVDTEKQIEVDLSTNEADRLFEDRPVEIATFGMGPYFDADCRFGARHGVMRSRVGMTGGIEVGPTKEFPKDHTEAIEISFDPSVTTYGDILRYFVDNHKITEEQEINLQSAIFYGNPTQRVAAEEFLKALQEEVQQPIATKVLARTVFYQAPFEDQHKALHIQEGFPLLQEMEIRHVEQLVHSYIACRLSGYISGYGNREDFEKDMALFQIPPYLKDEATRLYELNTINKDTEISETLQEQENPIPRENDIDICDTTGTEPKKQQKASVSEGEDEEPTDEIHSSGSSHTNTSVARASKTLISSAVAIGKLIHDVPSRDDFTRPFTHKGSDEQLSSENN